LSQGNLWTVPIGDDGDYLVTIFGSNNLPIAYTGSEPLAVQLWQGEGLAGVPGVLTASWTGGDPPSGVCQLSVAGASTAALTPDFYLWRLNLTTGGRKYEAADGWLRLGAAPGTDTAPITYCTLQDLIDYGGEWVTDLMVETSMASFLKERAQARRWMDRLIISKSRPYAYTLADYLVAGYSSANYAAELPDMYIVGLLQAGTTMLLTPDLIECVAYKALQLICEKAFTWGTNDNDTYHLRASYFRTKCSAMISSMVVTFDTINTPPTTPAIAVALGRHSIR
jgi:hypothetical protein